MISKNCVFKTSLNVSLLCFKLQNSFFKAWFENMILSLVLCKLQSEQMFLKNVLRKWFYKAVYQPGFMRSLFLRAPLWAWAFYTTHSSCSFESMSFCEWLTLRDPWEHEVLWDFCMTHFICFLRARNFVSFLYDSLCVVLYSMSFCELSVWRILRAPLRAWAFVCPIVCAPLWAWAFYMFHFTCSLRARLDYVQRDEVTNQSFNLKENIGHKC